MIIQIEGFRANNKIVGTLQTDSPPEVREVDTAKYWMTFLRVHAYGYF